eukprot:CAMPEP_0202466580 /NCGR_PEP_ID=MMETSP1360-20130828/69192_1 /ASSEMBLY_ACC=CAM_ASM_000848 /TAXON_ID=515479 /ORGANISM="Licmophora paradoxa, Strain CCMP2313" /LENGTH=74 /DNA_ID=CAMNT_0049090765 /DNA_START=21 /DNA_END=242 /DNA_ORIENTATION=+
MGKLQTENQTSDGVTNATTNTTPSKTTSLPPLEPWRPPSPEFSLSNIERRLRTPQSQCALTRYPAKRLNQVGHK